MRKYISYVIGILLFLLLMLWLLLQTQFGQNQVMKFALNSVSDILDTKVEAQKAEISFFDELTLHDFIIHDAANDTLLFVEVLKIDIGLFSFFTKQLQIDHISLSGSDINLYELPAEQFNYSQLIDHLSSGSESNEESKPQPWDFSIAEIALSNTTLNFATKGDNIKIYVDHLLGDIQEIATNESIYALNSMDIKGLDFFYNGKSVENIKTAPTVFPALPFDLIIKKLKIESNTIEYYTHQEHNTTLSFDPAHLDIDQFILQGENFHWHDAIQFDLKKFSATLENKVTIHHFSSGIHLSNTNLQLNQFDLRTESSQLNLDGEFTYPSFEELLTNIKSLDANITLENASVSQNDLSFFVDYTSFREINLKELEKIQGRGSIILQNGKLSFNEFSVECDEKLFAKGDFSIDNFTTNTPPTIAFQINSAKTHQSFLEQLFPTLIFPTEIKNQGWIQGSFAGVLDQEQLNFNSLNIKSRQGIHLSGRGEISNFNSLENLSFDFKVNTLKAELADLFHDPSFLPDELKRLEKISYTGLLQGNLKDIIANGLLTTSIGNLELDAQTTFTDSYSHADYSGYFDLSNFDLGYMLNDTLLGISNFKGTIEGSGLKLEDFEADVKGTVESFCYNGNIYKDIQLDGSYRDSIFIGKINSADENFKINLDGRLDLKGISPTLDITMDLNSLNLKELGITESDMVLGGIYKGQFQGNSVDDFITNGTISGFRVKTQKGHYTADSIITIHVKELNKAAKFYSLKGPFLDAEIQGIVQPSTLVRFVKNYIKKYIPLEYGFNVEEEKSLAKYFQETADQKFIIALQTKDLDPLLQPLFGEKIKLKETKLNAYFSSEESRLDVKGKIDSLLYNGVLFQRGSYFFDGRKSFINGNINIEDMTMDNEILVPITTVNGVLNNEKADIRLVMADENEIERLNLSGDFTRTEDYIFSFKDSLFLSGNKWAFSPYNQIIYGDDGLYMQDVRITKNNQGITLYTDENENGLAIEALFDNFILSELTSIINKENEYVEGKIDGSMIINSLKSKPFITADLTMRDVSIDGRTAGTLTVEAAQNLENNTVNSSIKLMGPENDASLTFIYGTENQSTKGELDIQKLEMAVIDPYLTDIFIDNEGYIDGKINIDGTINTLELSGKLSTHEIQTTPVFTNSRYTILDTDILFSDTEVNFGRVELLDRNNNSAFLTGTINHKNLRKSVLDFSVNTTNFEFLNTTENENELFYGNVFIKGGATIQGPIDDIRIEGAVSAINNSTFTVSPLAIEGETFNDDFIIYGGNPRLTPLDSIQFETPVPKILLPFDVDVKVNVGTDSRFTMVLNPITGDQLTCSGTSELNLKLNKAGEMELFGTYTVNQGNYAFSYGLISKKFKIQPNSSVSFSGNPLEGILDVEAIYVANTAVFDLLNLESELSASQKSEAQRKRDMNVVLRLSKSILKPEIILDITTSTDDLSSISDLIQKKLNQLREEPNELNNQVFGLMLFNNFILAKNAETDLAKTGTDFAIRSISGLISNQLNQLADGILGGFEVNFDVNSYSSDYLAFGQKGVITELGLGVKKSLFDNRLTISAGTNVNLESSSKTSDFNTIAGDFVIEYRIKKQGNYKVRIFRKSSFDRLVDENSSKNGASFFIKKEFGEIKKEKK
ncbi:MAG: translocation/assembly module TamB domain-containing protein [Saprospiraceae bacterium]|nr:translocation/assembly module TamB domain-containing protein [Saprospiraceae bacterium]